MKGLQVAYLKLDVTMLLTILILLIGFLLNACKSLLKTGYRIHLMQNGTGIDLSINLEEAFIVMVLLN